MRNRARRFAQLPGSKRGPAGERLCRWCSKPVPPGRREWCGQACIDDYLVRASQAGVRRFAWKRDRGVCAGCAVDTGRLERLLRTLHRMSLEREPVERFGPVPPDVRFFHREWHCVSVPAPFNELAAARYELAEALINLWVGSLVAERGYVRTLWEADHAVPLVEGGDPGPENIRTLCIPCHRRVTRELRARLARARRPQQELPIGGAFPGTTNRTLET